MKAQLTFFSAFLICIISVNAWSLDNTYWIEEKDDYECPFFIKFGNTNYIVLNDCYGLPQSSIVERGTFLTSNATLTLSERKFYFGIDIFNSVKSSMNFEFKAHEGKLELIYENNVFIFESRKFEN